MRLSYPIRTRKALICAFFPKRPIAANQGIRRPASNRFAKSCENPGLSVLISLFAVAISRAACVRISTDGWNDICRHRLLEAGCSTAIRVDFLPLKFILPNWHQRFTSCHKRFAIVLFFVIIKEEVSRVDGFGRSWGMCGAGYEAYRPVAPRRHCWAMDRAHEGI